MRALPLLCLVLSFVCASTALAQQAVLPDELLGVQKFALTVQTDPANATVDILNIGPEYHDGILLEPGSYTVQVSKPGYMTRTLEVVIEDQDMKWGVALAPAPGQESAAPQPGPQETATPAPQPAGEPNPAIAGSGSLPADFMVLTSYGKLRLKADRILKPGDDLRQAVSSAAPGALLVLEPGTYKVSGTWDLKKSIHLAGPGPDRAKILVEDMNVIDVGGQVRFEGIAFAPQGNIASAVVYSQGANLNMENCRIEKSNGGYAGLEVNGGAINITNCEFINNSGTGVFIYAGAIGTFRNNLSEGNGKCGISVEGGADPLVEGNRFVNNNEAGILVYSSGKGTFRNNLSERSGTCGMTVMGKGDPLVEGNSFVNNCYYGIYVYMGGKGTYRDNLFGKGTQDPLAIEVEASPGAVFSGNQVDGNVKGVSSY